MRKDWVRMTNEQRRERFLEAVRLIAAELYDFHERWDFTVEKLNKGRTMAEVAAERVPIVEEEFNEWVEAVGRAGVNPYALEEEVGDLIFVALGNAYSMGLNGLSAMERIAQSNATKTHKTHAIRKDTGKLISLQKPEKWVGAEDQLEQEVATRVAE